MAEYQTRKAVVRVHGEVDRQRIERACLAYLEQISQTQNQTKQGGHKK